MKRLLVMFLILNIVLGVFVANVIGIPAVGWRKKGAFDQIHYDSLLPTRRSSSNEPHECIISIHSDRFNYLESIVADISNPLHSSYGHHWSREQVASFLHTELNGQFVETFLTANGFEVVPTPYYDFLTVRGSIGQWEALLLAEFHQYEHSDWENKIVNRARSYYLPETIFSHVAAVFGAVDFPVKASSHIRILDELDQQIPAKKGFGISLEATSLLYSYVTPARVNAQYKITNNTGNNLATQAVYSTIGQKMSPRDLTTFQQTYGLPVQGITTDIGGGVINSACSASTNDCIEANLDIQYMMATAQSIPTTHYFWAGSDIWYTWIVAAASQSNPAQIYSISYGSYEAAFPVGYLTAFQNQAIILSAMGVTLVASSGDDGVSGFLVSGGTLSCAYYAQFPASSPYVLSVGGTMGPEFNSAEVACQTGSKAFITTGGGFSTRHTTPSFMASYQSTYFTNVQAAGKTPVTGYGSGRGYPDISALANRYLIVANGSTLIVGGTSASAPVVAGMIALVNSRRLAAGGSTMGWVNPFLYTYASRFTTDITSGDNKCTSKSSICCTQGFYATTGWDPVTGLGVLDFTRLMQVALVEVMPTISPTLPPTTAPTANPTAPTASPTDDTRPTYAPSVLSSPSTSGVPIVQSSSPSFGPSDYPSYNPSAAPTLFSNLIPSSPPTAEPTKIPTGVPSATPSIAPSFIPTRTPSTYLTVSTNVPTSDISVPTTTNPSTTSPTAAPSVFSSTATPSLISSSQRPSFRPSSGSPSCTPTALPSNAPTLSPLTQQSLSFDCSQSFVGFPYLPDDPTYQRSLQQVLVNQTCLAFGIDSLYCRCSNTTMCLHWTAISLTTTNDVRLLPGTYVVSQSIKTRTASSKISSLDTTSNVTYQLSLSVVIDVPLTTVASSLNVSVDGNVTAIVGTLFQQLRTTFTTNTAANGSTNATSHGYLATIVQTLSTVLSSAGATDSSVSALRTSQIGIVSSSVSDTYRLVSTTSTSPTRSPTQPIAGQSAGTKKHGFLLWRIDQDMYPVALTGCILGLIVIMASLVAAVRTAWTFVSVEEEKEEYVEDVDVFSDRFDRGLSSGSTDQQGRKYEVEVLSVESAAL